MSEGLTFESVTTEAKRHAEALCRRLLPCGVREGHRWRCGDISGNKGQSLVMNIDGPHAGCWHDFNGGDRGDFIDLIQRQRGGTKRDALKELARLLGIPHD